MGISHHLAGKFSLSCMGKASMEHWRFVPEQLVMTQSTSLSGWFAPRIFLRLEFWTCLGGWHYSHLEKVGTTTTMPSNIPQDTAWNGGRLTWLGMLWDFFRLLVWQLMWSYQVKLRSKEWHSTIEDTHAILWFVPSGVSGIVFNGYRVLVRQLTDPFF